MNITTPETLGFSSQRLGRIGQTMQRYVDEKKLAGTLTLIARRGRIVHLETTGMADIEAGKPMQADTIFRIYSMTKPIASTALLMLFEEGRLRLTDPVSKYIPAFGKMKVLENICSSMARLVEPQREVTVHDLLTHTSGLSYGFDPIYLDELYKKQIWEVVEANPAMTLEECVDRIAQMPLAFQPGTAWRYSLATDVVGCLVQIISGRPLGDHLKERILDPLGMVDTHFATPPEKMDRFSTVYGPDPEVGLKVVDARTSPRFSDLAHWQSAGGGLVSTASDYLRFSQMLLNKGELDGVRLLGRKTVEAMTCNHLPDGVTTDPDGVFGFGLGVNYLLNVGKAQTLGSVGNFGWGGAACTNFWVDQSEEMIGIFMAQFMPDKYYPVIADFRILAYQALVN